MSLLRKNHKSKRERLGITGSLGLAFKIIAGSLRLLLRYPKIILPLLPVFGMVLLVDVAIHYLDRGASIWLILLAIFAVAYMLLFSFAISSRLLKQIDQAQEPSLTSAITSPEMIRMIPRLFVLSIFWYGLEDIDPSSQNVMAKLLAMCVGIQPRTNYVQSSFTQPMSGKELRQNSWTKLMRLPSLLVL
jgi:hypothetical protein